MKPADPNQSGNDDRDGNQHLAQRLKQDALRLNRSVPPGLHDRIMQAVEKRVARRRAPADFFSFFSNPSVAVGIAALIILLASLVVFRHPRTAPHHQQAEADPSALVTQGVNAYERGLQDLSRKFDSLSASPFAAEINRLESDLQAATLFLASCMERTWLSTPDSHLNR